MALYIVKPWYKKQAAPAPIYGAEWAGTSSPSWVRTDAAVGFSAPNPYYSGMSGTPSSPFDNIMPWSGMRRVTDASAGELVEIPKFYYKWTRDGVKMKLQISMEQFDGSHVSPAHADRGDGVGERDYVYVGRYHCASDYKSKTGVTPKGSTTAATFRTGIHNLGANIWQNDYALFWTIRMLYLVEFANWDVQTVIGMGCGTVVDGVTNTGASDTMPYHTGSMTTSRSDFGVGVQYRYIEDLWSNAINIVDGFGRDSSRNLYSNNNPSSVLAGNWGNKVGSTTQASTTIIGYTIPSNSDYALVPNLAQAEYTNTYVKDVFWGAGLVNQHFFFTGGRRKVASYDHSRFGLFDMDFEEGDNYTAAFTSSRLMVLPPSRLSA